MQIAGAVVLSPTYVVSLADSEVIVCRLAETNMVSTWFVRVRCLWLSGVWHHAWCQRGGAYARQEGLGIRHTILIVGVPGEDANWDWVCWKTKRSDRQIKQQVVSECA